MTIYSYAKESFQLIPVEVEVALKKGLPQIQIVGLPDKVIKESIKRIETAFVQCGFRMPRAQQIIVNLRPNDLSKKSSGLDFAIALAILNKLELVDLPEEEIYAYGELRLNGDVHCPKDMVLVPESNSTVLTGVGHAGSLKNYLRMSHLRGTVQSVIAPENPQVWERPSLSSSLSFDEKTARLLSIIALGEHSCLLAGPAGSGKSTLASAVSSLLAEPDERMKKDIEKFSYVLNEKRNWRPFVRPHHCSTVASLIGGGVPFRPGEIFRAHHGVLLLDELLEFDMKVQGALREPTENGVISVAKSGRRFEYPCRFLLLATTNLCRCGEFVLNESCRCRCSSKVLRGCLEKLTGPFVDRFDVFHLLHSGATSKSDQVTMKSIFENCEKARAFQQTYRQSYNINRDWAESEILATMQSRDLVEFLPYFKSHRRKISLLRVARTVADLDHSEKIQLHHLKEAEGFCLGAHREIQYIDL